MGDVKLGDERGLRAGRWVLLPTDNRRDIPRILFVVRRVVSSPFPVLIDCHNHVGASPRFTLADFPYAQDLPTLVKEGDRHGITHWIVFPFSLNLTFNVSALRRGEFTTEGGEEKVPYAFENRRVRMETYTFFPEYSDRILPFASVDPSRCQESQVEELTKLHAERPIHGLKIQATTLRSYVSDLTKKGRVLLDFAAANDLPFIIHSSVAANDPWSPAEEILKVVRATPGVRFCLAHSCRFDRHYLDEIAELPNAWFDISAHGIHCIAAAGNLPIIAARERRFDSDYTNPARVLKDLADAYPRKLLWGTDSPFYSFITDRVSLKSSYADEVGYLKALPADHIGRVAGRNILDYLRPKSGRLASL